MPKQVGSETETETETETEAETVPKQVGRPPSTCHKVLRAALGVPFARANSTPSSMMLPRRGIPAESMI